MPCAARAASRSADSGASAQTSDVGGEDAGPDDQQPPPPEMIAERAAEQQQRRQRQQVGVDHPLHFLRAGAVAVADRGKGDAEDRAVDERQARGEDAGDERPARVGARLAAPRWRRAGSIDVLRDRGLDHLAPMSASPAAAIASSGSRRCAAPPAPGSMLAPGEIDLLAGRRIAAFGIAASAAPARTRAMRSTSGCWNRA